MLLRFILSNKLWITFFLLLSLAGISEAAFKINPILVELTPTGRGAQKFFQITSLTQQPMAVQVQVTTWEPQANGEETRRPADDQFLVYPQQMIIPPGTTQNVRVQWLGDTQIESERAFRLIVEQVPVKLSEQEKPIDVKVVMKVIGGLIVAPEGARHAVVAEQITARNVGGQKKLALTVRNTGNKYAVLANPQVMISNGSQTVTLQSEQLSELAGRSVLAGKTREVLLPWPRELRDGPLQAELSYRWKNN